MSPSRSSSRKSEAPLTAKRQQRGAAGDADRADAVFAALAHPGRRHILLVLRFRGGRMTAGEIAERFSCTWPTTSRHLGVLTAAKLLRVEKRGRARVYHLNTRRLRAVTGEWLRWFDSAG